ncbi:unnamed protein product [Pleuronectes platessa]|uniref:Uncharacterized protein n=1 Tax=Pleuronectes platessa TaxID=8262 RepID=A0A9N7UQ34_PLEPL|nr:unnamed protein product [Pleuronectes platessa]
MSPITPLVDLSCTRTFSLTTSSNRDRRQSADKRFTAKLLYKNFSYIGSTAFIKHGEDQLLRRHKSLSESESESSAFGSRAWAAVSVEAAPLCVSLTELSSAADCRAVLSRSPQSQADSQFCTFLRSFFSPPPSRFAPGLDALAAPAASSSCAHSISSSSSPVLSSLRLTSSLSPDSS